MRRLFALGLAAAAASAALSAHALAQGFPGEFGGGSTHGGSLLVVLQTDTAPSETPSVFITARTVSRCPGNNVVDIVIYRNMPAFPSGAQLTFAAAGAVHPPDLKGVLTTVRYRLSGSYAPTDGRASGTLHLKVTRRAHGRTRRCESGSEPFQARVPTTPQGEGSATKPATPLRGLTSQRVDGLGGPVSLYPFKRANQIYMDWAAALVCRKGTIPPFSNLTPLMRLRAGGEFSVHERFSVLYTDAVVRYVEETHGRLLTGGASGGLRLRAKVYSLHGHRLLNTCDSRPVSWIAVP